MKRLLGLSLTGLVLVLTGCAQQAPIENQDTSQPVANAAINQTPQIISATFDGNGVVIQGKNLSGSYVAFVHPVSPTGETLCREMITPSCVLQKSVSTDTTIKFISNWIGGEGSYQIYVENPKTGASNKVDMPILAQVDTANEKTASTATLVSEKAGGFIKQVYTKNGKHFLDIDYIQWLTEKDCKEKNLECNYNGYLILNQNTKIRTFEISQNVAITGDIYNNLNDQGNVDGVSLSYEDFKKIFAVNSSSESKNSMYWITVDKNIVTNIKEQYQP